MIPAGPAVVSNWWTATPPTEALPVTALMHWSAAGDLVLDRVPYGHKNRKLASDDGRHVRAARRIVHYLEAGPVLGRILAQAGFR